MSTAHAKIRVSADAQHCTFMRAHDRFSVRQQSCPNSPRARATRSPTVIVFGHAFEPIPLRLLGATAAAYSASSASLALAETDTNVNINDEMAMEVDANPLYSKVITPRTRGAPPSNPPNPSEALRLNEPPPACHVAID